MKNLGNRIRNLRKEKKITLRELGTNLNISFSLLAMYERGERVPPLDKLNLLADFFKVTTDYLIGKSKIRNFPETDLRYHYDDNLISELIYIPVINRINSSETIIAEENVINYRILNKNEIDKKKCLFYMRVEDDSMIDSRIKPDSLILVNRQTIFRNGDICVLLFNQRTFIRKLYIVEEQLVLQADNPNYEPIITLKNQALVIGKVVKIELDL